MVDVMWISIRYSKTNNDFATDWKNSICWLCVVLYTIMTSAL